MKNGTNRLTGEGVRVAAKRGACTRQRTSVLSRPGRSPEDVQDRHCRGGGPPVRHGEAVSREGPLSRCLLSRGRTSRRCGESAPLQKDRRSSCGKTPLGDRQYSCPRRPYGGQRCPGGKTQRPYPGARKSPAGALESREAFPASLPEPFFRRAVAVGRKTDRQCGPDGTAQVQGHPLPGPLAGSRRAL